MRVSSAWVFRALWVVLPLVAGPAVAGALDDRSGLVGPVGAVLAWGTWAGVLVAALVPSTVSLTVCRVLAPAAAVATVGAVAVVAGGDLADVTALDVVGLLVATAAAVVVMAPRLGDQFVDGSSYGPERRFALRVPAPVLFGPVELSWLVAVAGVVTGPLLLAGEQWVAGAVALVVGLPLAWFAWRSLHALSTRWLVFVPGGMVIHDPMSVTESVLMPRNMVAHVGPAPAGSDASALTRGAAGLALQVDLTETLPISVYRPRSRTPETATVERLLFTPTLPAEVLDTAEERRLPVP